jgi:hypothetical protein
MNSPLKQKLLLLRWRLYRFLERPLWTWTYKLTRPASDPFLSGDGFRRLADHVYDETTRHFRPEDVHDGEVIFASTYHARRFFENVEPGIQAGYRLITHNSDLPVDEELFKLCTEKLQVWYAQNATWKDERLVPIPIGLENLHHYHAGVPKEYLGLRLHAGPRMNRILAGFAVVTNPQERQRVSEIAQAAPLVDTLSSWLGQQEYLKTLVNYRFVLSPPGNGLDTHRTWEAMYLGVVPIVKDSVAMRSFERLGLPVWIVQSWDELRSLSEEDLDSHYQERQRKFEAPPLFMDYWNMVIRGAPAAAVLPQTGSASGPSATREGR